MSTGVAVTDEALVRAVEIFARIGRMLERIDTGLTLPQYRMLKLLATGTERSTAIATRLAVSKPTVSAAVDALVDQGRVRRNADSGDKRVTWLEITPAGTQALGAADEAFVGRFGPLIQSLPAAEALLAGLTQLNGAFDDARERRLSDRGPV